MLRFMCCFSGPVQEVKNTRIFARLGERGNQVLIYQMAVKAKEDLAMVLPIPVKKGSGENAVQFFDFQRYPALFSDLHKGFPEMQNFGSRSAGPFGDAPAALPTLAVVSVGSYDASYVPTIPDFARLDERFRLPEQVWEKLPGYRDFGFVVFKLKLDQGAFHSHPMAFAFPTAMQGHLFFPTLHIHDGKVHQSERFDHTLYCQASGQELALWRESNGLAIQFAKCGLTHGMVRPDQHLHRRTLHGLHANTDILVKPKGA